MIVVDRWRVPRQDDVGSVGVDAQGFDGGRRPELRLDEEIRIAATVADHLAVLPGVDENSGVRRGRTGDRP